jgi:2-haloacid dehalogenase
MLFNRRDFVRLAARGLAMGVVPAIPHLLAAEPSFRSQIKAIAFDAFPIFDPRSVFALAEQLFPGRGAELSNEWRTRQFGYTWLRVAAGHYADFWHVTQDALEFAASKLSLELSLEKRDKLMRAYLELKPRPDVPAALASLKQSGFRLAFLSNFTRAMLDANIESAGLAGRFEQILSTDQAKTYKPDPRAYQLGIDALKLRREEILFVAYAGWDATGAKLFGYPTFWLNRQKLPAEKLDATPDAIGESFTQLLQFLKVSFGCKVFKA